MLYPCDGWPGRGVLEGRAGRGLRVVSAGPPAGGTVSPSKEVRGDRQRQIHGGRGERTAGGGERRDRGGDAGARPRGRPRPALGLYRGGAQRARAWARPPAPRPMPAVSSPPPYV